MIKLRLNFKRKVGKINNTFIVLNACNHYVRRPQRVKTGHNKIFSNIIFYNLFFKCLNVWKNYKDE